jgi:tetraacyldisaccharide 4'-kinase
MFENIWWRTVTAKKRNFGGLMFFWLLCFVSVFYYLGLLVKKTAYRMKFIKSKDFGVKIICAGNLTVGGTGKTPFIEEMAKRLIKEEKNVVIVCKGYKRQEINKVDVVSDGTRMLLKQRNAGDEAYMLARSVPKAKVIVAENKLSGIEFGVATFKPDFVLLDDGYQKRYGIENASHAVLIDALNPMGFNRLFPAGTLREPFSEIKHADAVLITNTNLVDPVRLEKVKEAVLSYNKNMKIFESEHQPKMLYNITNGEKLDPSFLNEKKIIAFSSIGNPAGFERTLKNLGAHILVGLRFQDHHRLENKEMDAVMKLFDATKASMVVTTEKDEVKLVKKYIIDNRVFALKIGMLIKNVKELEKTLRISV